MIASLWYQLQLFFFHFYFQKKKITQLGLTNSFYCFWVPKLFPFWSLLFSSFSWLWALCVLLFLISLGGKLVCFFEIFLVAWGPQYHFKLSSAFATFNRFWKDVIYFHLYQDIFWFHFWFLHWLTSFSVAHSSLFTC